MAKRLRIGRIAFKMMSNKVRTEELKYHFKDGEVYLTDGTTYIPLKEIRKSIKYSKKSVSRSHTLDCLMNYIKHSYTEIRIEYHEYVNRGVWQDTVIYKLI